jgi:hypothetical protein
MSFLGNIQGDIRANASDLVDRGKNILIQSRNEVVRTQDSINSSLGTNNNIKFKLSLDSTIKFPADLPADRPVLELHCLDARPNLNLGTPIFYFPAPENIQSANGSTYDDTSLSAAGAALAPTLNSANASGANLDSISEGALKSLNDMVNSIIGSDVSSSASLFAANKLKDMGGVAPEVAAAMRISSRAMLNPNVVTEFTGTNTREYSFEYQLIPSSQAESQIIEKIVKFFQVSVYAEREGFLLNYPPRWKIKILKRVNGEKIENIPEMHHCFLTSFDVSYNGSVNAFFSDGNPVETTISFAFKETRALSANDILELQSDQANRRIDNLA